MTYKFLPEIAIADIAFQAFGTDLNDLFESAAIAVADSMADLGSIEGTTKKKILIEENKIDMLLFDFLNEIILLKDTEELLFKKFEVKVYDDEAKHVECVAHGEKINRDKHRFKNDLKAVTLHMFEVTQEKDRWKATVVVDI